MTREEAIEGICGYGWSEEKMIEFVYDDFESRICKNCRAWTMEIHCEVLDMVTDENFGCNRFEGK